MRQSILRATFGAIAFIATSGHALAQASQDFTLDNQSGSVVVSVSVSAVGEMNWGPDILGAEVLASGEQAEVAFDNLSNACEWDIRVTYEDGTQNDMRGVNLCETSSVQLTP